MNDVVSLTRRTIAGVPEGVDALVLSDLARNSDKGHLHVVSDDIRLATLKDSLQFFSPDVTVYEFPAWDCVPYDLTAC